MAMMYRTEYRLGRGEVAHTYTGPAALAAIGFDLLLTLVLTLVGLVLVPVGWVLRAFARVLVGLPPLLLRAGAWIVVAFARVFVGLAAAPLRLAAWMLRGSLRGVERASKAVAGVGERVSNPPLPAKPAWTGLDEL